MERLPKELNFKENISLELLKAKVQNISVCDLFQPRGFSLNLLHLSILSRNANFVSTLLQKSEKNDIEKESKLPYLHLAAIVGCPEIAALLCKRFKAFVREPNVEWLGVIEECLKDKNSFKKIIRSDDDDDNFTNVLLERMQNLVDSNIGAQFFSSIDVAAACGTTECLKTLLLGQCSNTLVNFPLLQKCVDVDSLRAFEHLLQHSPSNLLLKTSQHFLKQLHLDAIRILLKCGAQALITESFSPFHMALCHSSSSTQHDKYKHLHQVFALLLESKFDVNERRFVGEYPLYSMLHSLLHQLDNNPLCVPDYHIRPLELLIHEGADLNYNELRAHRGSHVLCSRDLFSSALNAFFESMQACESWSPVYMEHLDRVCLLLLENGADSNQVNSLNEPPLHSLMRLAAEQHSHGHLSADFFSMTRQLLYFGANPNLLLQPSLLSPLAYYFCHLFDSMGGHHAYDRWLHSEVLSQTLPILNYMQQDVAYQTIACIKGQLEEKLAQDEDLSSEMAEQVNASLKEYMPGLRSLQDCCKLALWHACGRKVPLLKQLQLPIRLLREFDSLFVLSF